MYFNMYLFFMRKISLFVLFLFVYLDKTFAVIWVDELEKTKEQVGFISSFFTTDLLLDIVFATLVIIATFTLSKVVSKKIEIYISRSSNWESREELVWVLTRVSNISILTLGTAISLWILWVDMWIFIWGIGFWLGFTLKIFLSNFIAWVIMVTQWSYHNWDLIEIWWKIWYIKKINALFTEVEQFNWVIIFIPNVDFLNNKVLNYDSNDKRRIEIDVWVDYDTDILKAKKIIYKVLNNFPNILRAPEPDILVSWFGDSSINISIRFWINSKADYHVIKSNVTETINLAFKQAEITIPFPQVTLSNRENFKITMTK